MADLLPVKNFRSLYHRRACSRCRHWVLEEESLWACQRPDGPWGDWNTIEPEWHVCDRFAWGNDLTSYETMVDVLDDLS